MADTTISGIYRIRNTVNGRVYVGSSVHIPRRWLLHKKQLLTDKHHCRFLQFAWNKYGETAFVFEILEAVKDVDRLIEREQHWIDALGAYNKHGGYNLAPKAGSSLGVKQSDEARAKMKAARMTPEARAANSARQLGKKRSAEATAKWTTWVKTPEGKETMRLAQLGRKATEAAKEANRQGQTGRRHSEETKEKMRLSSLNRRHSDESRKKISDAKKGKRLRMRSIEEKSALRDKLSEFRKGRRMSEETKAKIGSANRGKPRPRSAKRQGELPFI